MRKSRSAPSFLQKLLAVTLLFFVIAAVCFWIVADDWDAAPVSTESVSTSNNTGNIAGGSGVTQTFVVGMDRLDEITLMPTAVDRDAGGSVVFSIYDGETLLWSAETDYAPLPDWKDYSIAVAPGIEGYNGKTLTLTIRAQGGIIAFGTGDSVSTGRMDVPVDTDMVLTVNDAAAHGSLRLMQGGADLSNASHWYWPCAVIVYALGICLLFYVHQRRKKGRRSIFVILMDVYRRYRYLIKQLITRDFKVKYKSSVLGILWSFLNPLLMMAVYYFVFSTLFQSDIENFAVYLLSGTILMNYFSDATSLGLNSITGNSHLITKVYMPKMIYPLCKVLSSGLNLVISFLPMLIMMLVTGAPFTNNLLLLPFVLLFLCMFSMGMSLLLATLNVFFRDTQFLWSIMLTMWTFLTPIFYPMSIIPDSFNLVYQFNPMYHIVNFMRDITLYGIAPQPLDFLLCTVSSVIPLLLGFIVFRKKQDRFVLYL